MRNNCPACGTRSKKYWKVYGEKAKCFKCGYIHKDTSQQEEINFKTAKGL